MQTSSTIFHRSLVDIHFSATCTFCRQQHFREYIIHSLERDTLSVMESTSMKSKKMKSSQLSSVFRVTGCNDGDAEHLLSGFSHPQGAFPLQVNVLVDPEASQGERSEYEFKGFLPIIERTKLKKDAKMMHISPYLPSL